MSRVIEAANRFAQRDVSGRATTEEIDEKQREVSGGKLVGISYSIEDYPNGTHQITNTRLTFYKDGQGEEAVEELPLAA